MSLNKDSILPHCDLSNLKVNNPNGLFDGNDDNIMLCEDKDRANSFLNGNHFYFGLIALLFYSADWA